VHYNKSLNENENQQRMNVIKWSHIMAASTLFLDLVFNKIRVPFRQIWITVGTMAVIFVITFLV